MFDHLFHAAQHGVQGLVLGNHLEDLAAIVLEPFHPLALADIPRDAQYSHRQAIPELHPATDLHGDPVAVPCDQLRFQRQGRFASQPRRHDVPDGGQGFGRRELLQIHAEQLSPAVPRDLLSDGVDRGEAPFQIDGENDIAGIFDQHAVALFAVAQGRLDAFQLRDIAETGCHRADSGLLKEVGCPTIAPAPAPIGMPQPQLRAHPGAGYLHQFLVQHADVGQIVGMDPLGGVASQALLGRDTQ